MIGDPYVDAECSYCASIESVSLTPLAQNCFDMRGVLGELKAAGWIIDSLDDELIFCQPECRDDWANSDGETNDQAD